jgi:Two component regulator propeller
MTNKINYQLCFFALFFMLFTQKANGQICSDDYYTSGYINAFASDSRGKLWISTTNGLIAELNGITWTSNDTIAKARNISPRSINARWCRSSKSTTFRKTHRIAFIGFQTDAT